jgi:NCS2 family nucleobase:cation symporter-2
MKIWSLHGDGKSVAPGEVVAPSERLNWPATIAIGVQHVVAMFGATFLVPVLTGFPVPTTLLFSGVGTLLFLIITRNKLPSYLGSSFAFIAPVTAATASAGMGSALAGIVAVGILLAIVGVIANVTGTGWIDKLMPPVVAGAIVALIGFNLAPVAWSNFEQGPLVAAITLTAVVLFSVLFRGFLGRISIFLGVVVGYIAAALLGELDLSAVEKADWIGLPTFHLADFASAGTWSAIAMFLPVVLVLIAENVGHVRAVAAMTDKSVNASTGKALIADVPVTPADLLLAWAANSGSLDTPDLDVDAYIDPETGRFGELPDDVVYFDGARGRGLELATQTPQLGDDGRSLFVHYDAFTPAWETTLAPGLPAQA